MNKKAVAILIFFIFTGCNTSSHYEACPGCISPSVVLSFYNASTNQKIILSGLTAIYSNTDTISVSSNSRTDSDWCFFSPADSAYSVFHGPGSYKIIMNDPLYAQDSLDTIRVVDDGTVCKRIYTRYFDVGLVPKSLAKTGRKQALIIRQSTKLGC